MKRQFSLDRLIIENGCVTIRSGDDDDFHIASVQLVNLVKAGYRFSEVVILRSEAHDNQ
jgi:hypothetical protein